MIRLLRPLFASTARSAVQRRGHHNGRRVRLESLESRRLLAGDSFETILVTTDLDIVDSGDNRTSLREAIAMANQNASPSIIRFSTAVDFKPIFLSQNGPDATAGDLDITQGNITIQGNGRKNTIIRAGGSETGFSDRIFHVQGTANVVFVGLTIRGGKADHGGGILHSGTGQVMVNDVLLTENTAINTGGAIAAFRGVLNVIDSTIETNSAAFGGGIGSLVPLSLKDSSVVGNVASSWGGGVYSQGPDATTTIESSTFFDNRGRGGGLVNRNSTSEINKSTFSGNSSSSAGAILNIADSAGASSVSIRRSTFTNNQSGGVGSVHTMASIDAASAPLTFGTSLFVGNRSTSGSSRNLSSDSTKDQNATIISTGRNLLDDDGAGSLTTTDVGNVDTLQTPVINPTLADNGGATKTHALVFGSPAVGGGGSEFEFAGQRGPVLPENLATFSPTDIGAYQVRVPEILLSVSEPRVTESGSTTLDVVAEARAVPSDLEAAGPITVQLSTSGTAIANEDYTLSAHTIIIPQGSKLGSVTLTAIDDPIVESEFETVTLRIGGVSGNSRLGQTTSKTVQIQDDDEAEISLTGTDVSPRETTAHFEIRLSHPVDIPVRVGFRTNDGEAVAGVHFEGVADQTVEFAVGQTVATVEVPLIAGHTGKRTFTGEITWVEAEERIVKHVSFTKTRISHPVVIGDVQSHVLSDDGSTLIYVADQDTFEVNELYSVPADGSAAPVKLNAPLEPGQDISESVALTTDGEWAVYKTAGTPRFGALLSVRSDGSAAPLQLTPAYEQSGSWISEFVISPDGNRVVYRVTASDNSVDLYSVPINGTAAAIKLNETALNAQGRPGNPGGIQLSADGTRVLYIARQQPLPTLFPSKGPFNLLSFPIDRSGEPTQINASLEYNENVTGMSVSSNDNTVVYVAGNNFSEDVNIYRAVVDGSAEPIQLTTSPPAQTNLDNVPLTISADGSTVAYLIHDGTSDRASLHSVQANGQSPALKLEGTSKDDYSFREPFFISSDGSRLVYTVNDYIYPSYADRILSIATDGTETPFLLFREAGIYPKLHALSPDSERIFFSLVRPTDIDKTSEFYSVATDGSTPATKIVGGLPEKTRFTVSKDGSFLIYQTDQHTGGANELHRIALDEPSHTTRLNGDLVTEDRVSGLPYGNTSLSEDGSRILYRTPAGYYAAPTDASTTAIKLDISYSLSHLTLSPDGRWVIFQSDQFTFGQTQLYAVPTSYPSKPIMLSTGIPRHQSLRDDWFVTPDSRSVVFGTGNAGNVTLTLYSVSIDGSSAPKTIQSSTENDAGISNIVVDDQGRHIAFVRHASDYENAEVFVARSDGTSAAVLIDTVSTISRPSTFARTFLNLTFDPGGTQLAYLAPRGEQGRNGLFIAPLDGTLPIRNLIANATQFSVLDVKPDFRFTSDSKRIIYRAANDTTHLVDLYSVLVDGSAKPIKLSPTNLLTANQQQVIDFIVSADSQSVLYRGQNRVSGAVSLMNGSTDGTALSFTVLESLLSNSAEEFYGTSWEKPLAFNHRYLVAYSDSGDGKFSLRTFRIDQPSAAIHPVQQSVAIGNENRVSLHNGQFLVPVYDTAFQAYFLSSFSATGTSRLDTAPLTTLRREEVGDRIFYSVRTPDSEDSPLYGIEARTLATIQIDEQLLGPSEDAEKVDAVFRLADPDLIEFVFDDGDAVIRSAVDELYRLPADRMNQLTIDVSVGGRFVATHESVAAFERLGGPLTVITGTHGKLQLPERWSVPRPQFIDAVLTHRGLDDPHSPTAELLAVAENVWQNPFDNNDVDGNGLIEPLDALLIINALQRERQSRIVLLQPTHDADSNMPEHFLDASGDEFVEPYDALLVINRLNVQARQNKP